MITETITPTAALRSRSESSFVVPTGAEAFWQHIVSHETPVDLFGNGFAHDASLPPAAMVTVAPMTGRRVRAAKQDRPPRGVPR
jgi:hypothetical protein